MKRLLIGAAVGALMLPATATFAQQMHTFDDGHAHECLNESCTVFSLFPTADQDPAGSGWQGTEAPKFGTWGFDLAGRDLSVAPGDDFFRYANGLAFDRLVIPSDRTSYGSFAILRELSDNRLKVMIDELTASTDLAAGSDELKIADLYRAYMDTDRIEALDDQPLQPYLADIRAIDSHDAMAVYMGGTQGRFGSSFFGVGIGDD
ncbi:MAG TPA: peptidase M13, partial [Brevundimonas sp.]|nr:peptidase M13 [Brevundimonas sp.]